MHPSQIASIKQRVLRTDVRRWAGRIDAVLDADDPEARFREATRA
jgi:phosphotransferase system enzyme I (PtsI)